MKKRLILKRNTLSLGHTVLKRRKNVSSIKTKRLWSLKPFSSCYLKININGNEYIV